MSQTPEHGDPAPPIAQWIAAVRKGTFAAAALNTSAGSLDLPAAVAALESTDVFARLAAVKALGGMTDRRAVDALTRLAANAAFPSTQLAAQRALAQLRSAGK